MLSDSSWPASCLGIVLHHLNKIMDILAAFVDVLPDELFCVCGGSGVGAPAAYKGLAMVGGLSRYLVRRVRGQESLKRHDLGFPVDRSQGVGIP